MLKVLVIVLATIVVLALIAVGVGYHLITQSSDVELEVSSVTVSEEIARSLDSKLEDFGEQLAAASEGEQLSLILTDDEITSKLVQELSRGDVDLPLDIKDPRITFVDDKVVASGEVDLSGFHTTVSVEVQVQVQNDKLQLIIDEVSLGRLPLPDVVLNRIKEGLIPEEEVLIDLDQVDIPMDIKGIRIEDGQIILEGVVS